MLRRRCVEGLGSDRFAEAHRFLKALQDAEESEIEVGGEGVDDNLDSDARLVQILGRDLVHYSSLIDQVCRLAE